MMNVLIVDDEAAACNMLRILVEKSLAGEGEVRCTTDPHEALRLIEIWRPSLLMLDIEMPEMTGFDLLARVPQHSFDVIFVTAYDRYAIKAIRFSALDYLMKPVDYSELCEALARHRAKQAEADAARKHQEQVGALFENIGRGDAKNFRLALSTSGGITLHEPAAIVLLEAHSNYTRFYFSNRKSELVCHTLKEYEDLLVEHGFARVHRGYLVNRAHVVGSRDGVLFTDTGIEVPVSRRKKAEVMDWLVE
jgi:two-component system LytT family response regulator